MAKRPASFGSQHALGIGGSENVSLYLKSASANFITDEWVYSTDFITDELSYQKQKNIKIAFLD